MKSNYLGSVIFSGSVTLMAIKAPPIEKKLGSYPISTDLDEPSYFFYFHCTAVCKIFAGMIYIGPLMLFSVNFEYFQSF